MFFTHKIRFYDDAPCDLFGTQAKQVGTYSADLSGLLEPDEDRAHRHAMSKARQLMEQGWFNYCGSCEVEANDESGGSQTIGTVERKGERLIETPFFSG